MYALEEGSVPLHNLWLQGAWAAEIERLSVAHERYVS